MEGALVIPLTVSCVSLSEAISSEKCLGTSTLPSLIVDDYVYDVRIKACDGTSSSSIQAYFCSVGVCDGTAGEEELVQLQMNDVEGGWTDISFPLPFNPMGMRLEEPVGTDTW